MYTVVFMTKQCFNAAMADIVNEGFMTKTQTGIIITVFYLVYAPTQIVGGFAADRWDSGRLIAIGLIGAVISNAVIFFNHSYPVMIAAWGFSALTQFALWSAVLKIFTTKLHVRHRFQAVAYITLAQPIGTVLSYLTASLIRKWEYNFAVSALALLAVTVLFCGVYEYLKRNALFAEDALPVGEEQKKSAQGTGMTAIIFGSGLVFLLFASLMKNMIVCGVRGLSPVMLMESYPSVTPKIGNSLNMIILIFGILAVLVAGYLNTHFMKKEPRITIIAWIATAPGWVVLFWLGKTNVMLAVFALAWIYGLLILEAATVQCWIARFQKYNCAGTVAGIMNAAASVGIVIQSYSFCAIADRSGWSYVIDLCILLSVLSLVFSACAAVFWKRFVRSPK